jgi:hypothetical protein
MEQTAMLFRDVNNSEKLIMQKVFEVAEVELSILESFPPKLRISAKGTVLTAGWTNPRLEPFIFIQPPPDGIYEFDFVADPPDGFPAQVITPIEAVYVWDNFPEGIKGVRVHASQNSKTALLHDSGHPDRQPTVYRLNTPNNATRVTFFPQELGPLGQGETGVAALEYDGPQGHRRFRGDEITQQETILGTLVSVTLEGNEADQGFLDLALVLPLFIMGDEAQHEFKTVGILSKGPSGFGGFRPGPQRTYEILALEGIAEYIPIL